MKYVLVIFLSFLVAACAPRNTYESPHDKIVKKCAASGYKDKGFDDCVSTATDDYNTEAAKESERLKKEMLKTQKETKKRQLAADKAQCDDYGIQRGTKDFSACLIQLDQARKQELQQQIEAYQAAQAQAQAQEQEDNARIWQGVANVADQLSQQ